MHYQNHLESVYCIEGESSETGQKYSIKSSVEYALDKHDTHTLRAFK
ncbi:ectoine synthase [Marinomonas sp. 5E14-1]